MHVSEPALTRSIDRKRLVYRWDLDKTYLRTEFDTVRDLFMRAFERASDKHTVPGAASLLREIRATEPQGLYILSGSPEQMRRVLEAKLRLDGIRWDGLTLKPSLKNLLRGHFGFLRDQVGYKLGALLGSREKLPASADEILFGDDAETDAFVYSLYADLCAGSIGVDVLVGVLEQTAATPEDNARLLRMLGRLPRRDHCLRIFIHLDRVSPLDTFTDYGSRVCPFYNYFQPAVVLLEHGAIDARAALRVAAELVIDQGFSSDALHASFLDVVRRKQVGQVAQQAIRDALVGMHSAELASATATLMQLGELLAKSDVPPLPAPSMPQEIDYVSLLGRERARTRAAKLRRARR